MSRRSQHVALVPAGKRLNHVLSVGHALRVQNEEVGVTTQQVVNKFKRIVNLTFEETDSLVMQLVEKIADLRSTEDNMVRADGRAVSAFFITKQAAQNIMQQLRLVEAPQTEASVEAVDTIVDNMRAIQAESEQFVKDGVLVQEGRDMAIRWLKDSPFKNTAEIMLFLPFAYADDQDLCRKMVIMYPYFVWTISTRLQMDPVIRLLCFHGTNRYCDAAMLKRDTPLATLEQDLDEDDRLEVIAAQGEAHRVVPVRYTRQQVLDDWQSAQSVVDIEVLIDNHYWVQRAVLYHGSVLRSMSRRLQQDVVLRLQACKTDSDAVLWVLSDLAEDHTKGTWWRLQTIGAIRDTWLGRVLPPGESIEKLVEKEQDAAILEYYSFLVQKLVEIYGVNEEGLTRKEAISRARIAARAEQIQAVLLSPDGIIFRDIVEPEAEDRGRYAPSRKKQRMIEAGILEYGHTHWQHSDA